MLKIYHNTRCKKSRLGLKYLQEKGLELEIVEYIKNPMTEKEFRQLLIKLNKSAFEMIRTQESIYKSEYKSLSLTEDEWIKTIVQNPKLLKRPIIETKLKAVWGDPVEEIDTVL